MVNEVVDTSNDDSDTGLSAADDIAAHDKLLADMTERASKILLEVKAGNLTPKRRSELKIEMPKVADLLRQLLLSYLQKDGALRQIDLDDGSYDAHAIENRLRIQIASLRNKHISMNTLLGTRTIRKLTGFIREDIPNFFTVKWRQIKDNVKQLAKTGLLVGALATAGAVGGYSYALGFGPGMAMLGSHLGIVGNAISTAANTTGSFLYDAGAKVGSMGSWTYGKIAGLFGKKIIAP